MQARTELYPSTHTGLEGISADGTDIYFSTFDTLVPQDGNGSFVKFYDARTGGGFPFTPPALPCSAADECHGDTEHAGPGAAGREPWGTWAPARPRRRASGTSNPSRIRSIAGIAGSSGKRGKRHG